MTFNIIILHTTDYNFWPPSIYMTFFKQSHKNMRYSTVWYCLYIHYMAVLFWNLSQCSVRSQEAACYIDFSRPGSLPWWIRTPPSPPLPAKCETFKRSLSIVCTYINCFFNSYKRLLKKKIEIFINWYMNLHTTLKFLKLACLDAYTTVLNHMLATGIYI